MSAAEVFRPDRSAEVAELAKAMALAQREVANASKDSVNPHFNRSYADLASVWEACREPLTKNGLSVIQRPVSDGNRVGVTTTILHSSGQWMESTLWTTPQQQGPQAMGSCITYLRRYSLSAVAGVAPDDDDGNAASGPPGRRKRDADDADARQQYREAVRDEPGPKALSAATPAAKASMPVSVSHTSPAKVMPPPVTGTPSAQPSAGPPPSPGAGGGTTSQRGAAATAEQGITRSPASSANGEPPSPNGTKNYVLAKDVPVFAKDPLANQAQLAQIHILRKEVNWPDGEVNESKPVKSWPLYRQALAAYKTHDGKRCLHSNQLTFDQAANLIRRMQASKGRKEDAHAAMEAAVPANMAHVNESPYRDARALDDELTQRYPNTDDQSAWLLSLFGKSRREELDTAETGAALSLLLVWDDADAYQKERQKLKTLGVVVR